MVINFLKIILFCCLTICISCSAKPETKSCCKDGSSTACSTQKEAKEGCCAKSSCKK